MVRRATRARLGLQRGDQQAMSVFSEWAARSFQVVFLAGTEA